MKILAKLLVGVASVAIVPAAWAQDTGQSQTGAPAPKADEGTKAATPDGDIIVTARRQKENILDVPVAISAFNGDAIKRLNVVDTASLGKLSAGLTVKPTYPSRDVTTPVIRAQGTTFGTGQSSVIPYFAEAPNFNLAYYDLANLQVLKGPQGTLFGETATGGVLLYEPVRPGNEFGGYFSLEKGNYDYTQIEGAIGGPIVKDVLLFRAAAQYRKRNGFTTGYSNTPGVPVQDLDNIDNLNVRLSLTFRPTTWLEVYTVGVYNRNNSFTQEPIIMNAVAGRNALLDFTPAQVFPFLGVSAAQGLASYQYYSGATPAPGQTWNQLQAAALARQQELGPRAMMTNWDHSRSIITRGFVNQIRAEIAPGIVLRNIFSMQETKQSGGRAGVSGSDVPIFYNMGLDCRPGVSRDGCYLVYSRQWTNETQVQAKLFGDRLNLQAGFYFRKNPLPDYRPVAEGIIAYGVLSGNPAPAAYCTSLGVAAGTPCSNLSRQTQEAYAVYGQGTFAITDSVHFTAGYRSIWDTTSSFNAAGQVYTVPYMGFNLPVPVAGAPRIAGSTETTLVYPKTQHNIYTLSGDWHITRDWLAYGTFSTGYKGGGINTFVPPAGFPQVFGPETVKSYELGLKGTMRMGDVVLRPTLAAYRADYSDIQRTISLPATINTITANVAAARIQGIEFELGAQFGRFISFDGYYAYTDGKYTNWAEDTVCSNATYAAPICASLPGTTPLRVDHVAGTFTAGGLTGRFTPDVFSNAVKNRFGLRPSINAGIFSPALEGLTVSANVYYTSKNVTDEVNFSRIADGKLTKADLTAPANTLVDLSVNWRNIKGSRLSVYATVTNLTNKTYKLALNNLQDNFGEVMGIYNEPRMAFVGLKVDF